MEWENYPLIRLIIPFTLGMVGANLFVSHMDLVVLFILCCAVLAFSFFFIKTLSTYKDGKFGLIATALFFLIGMTLYTGKHQSIEQSLPQDTTFCQGILTEAPIEKAHSWALHIQQGDTHLLLYAGKNLKDSITISSLQVGDTILANIRHLNGTNACENDTFKTYNTSLFYRGICATAYTPPDQWHTKSCQTSPSLFPSTKTLQGQLHTIYDDHGIQGEAGCIIEAMTIGRKTYLSKDTRNAYTNAGVSHILALSGFHVGIIVLMIQFFFFKNFLPLRWRWISNIFIIATLWGYALLTGLSPSLVRATIMFTILLLCQSLSRQYLSFSSCALAFFIMLCINPFYLNDIGFQLSFIAVCVISLYSQQIITLCPTHNRLIHFFWSIIMITLICSVFTAPLITHHFGKFTLLSLLSNLVVFPFVYLLIWTSILWWMFLWCEPMNDFLTDILNWTAGTMNKVVEYLSSLPFATIEWQPSVLMTWMCYGVLLVLTYFITRRNGISSSVR